MKGDRAIFAILAIAPLWVTCSREPEGSAPVEIEDPHKVDEITFSAAAYETAGLRVAPVELRSILPTVRVTGTLAYDQGKMAIATARIGGRIARVVADYGQRVAPGDVLAWIDSPELGAAQAEYRRAASMNRLREAEFERAHLLLEGEAISRAELLRREAEWRAAQADLQTAEQMLHILGLSQADVDALTGDGSDLGHLYPVRAPIEGRVTVRQAVPGRVVGARDELFTVATLDTLWLFVQVFEKDLSSIHTGSAVSLTCESHPEDRFTGSLDFVGQVLDPHSRTVEARAVIDNPSHELKPGMFVYATIGPGVSSAPADARPAVPAAAVVEIEGESVVFVALGERTFEVRPVVLGEAAGEWVEIRSGLTEGETVAVSGTFTLKSEVLKGGLAEHDH
jgi:cobalt-zinc-cadmium efflux system membrane fusion protein